mmetsp:Transcript_16346/g.33282  ORF Transcript_16346/g.33282 Transcript_16346/m.33282 type:complete len:129 (+) Transcript_16346:57-443(+)
MFGLVISGRPVITNFLQVDERSLVVEVPNGETVNEISFFVIPGATLPPGSMACLYASPFPFNEFNLVGSVTADNPSQVFFLRWKQPIPPGTALEVRDCRIDWPQLPSFHRRGLHSVISSVSTAVWSQH